jgi:hypothetical protein
MIVEDREFLLKTKPPKELSAKLTELLYSKLEECFNAIQNKSLNDLIKNMEEENALLLNEYKRTYIELIGESNTKFNYDVYLNFKLQIESNFFEELHKRKTKKFNSGINSFDHYKNIVVEEKLMLQKALLKSLNSNLHSIKEKSFEVYGRDNETINLDEFYGIEDNSKELIKSYSKNKVNEIESVVEKTFLTDQKTKLEGEIQDLFIKLKYKYKIIQNDKTEENIQVKCEKYELIANDISNEEYVQTYYKKKGEKLRSYKKNILTKVEQLNKIKERLDAIQNKVSETTKFEKICKNHTNKINACLLYNPKPKQKVINDNIYYIQANSEMDKIQENIEKQIMNIKINNPKYFIDYFINHEFLENYFKNIPAEIFHQADYDYKLENIWSNIFKLIYQQKYLTSAENKVQEICNLRKKENHSGKINDIIIRIEKQLKRSILEQLIKEYKI